MINRVTNPSPWLSHGVCLCVIVIAGCSGGASRYEGELAGDCTNAADDDRDGDFDCDDEGCARSPACSGVAPDAGGRGDAGHADGGARDGGPIDSGPDILLPDSGTPPDSCTGTPATPGQMRYVVRNGGNTQSYNRTLTACGTGGGAFVVTEGKLEIELPSYPGAITTTAQGTMDASFTGDCTVCFESARVGMFSCTALTNGSGATVSVSEGAFSCL